MLKNLIIISLFCSIYTLKVHSQVRDEFLAFNIATNTALFQSDRFLIGADVCGKIFVPLGNRTEFSIGLNYYLMQYYLDFLKLNKFASYKEADIVSQSLAVNTNINFLIGKNQRLMIELGLYIGGIMGGTRTKINGLYHYSNVNSPYSNGYTYVENGPPPNLISAGLNSSVNFVYFEQPNDKYSLNGFVRSRLSLNSPQVFSGFNTSSISIGTEIRF